MFPFRLTPHWIPALRLFSSREQNGQGNMNREVQLHGVKTAALIRNIISRLSAFGFFFFLLRLFFLPLSLQSGLHLCGGDTHTHRATCRYAHRSMCAHTHQTDGWSSVLTKAKAQGHLGSSKSLRLASRCLFRTPSVLSQTNVT